MRDNHQVSLIATGAGGVVTNVLTEVLIRTFDAIRQRGRDDHWMNEFAAELQRRGIHLDSGEARRLAHWIRNADLTTLRQSRDAPSCLIARMIDTDVLCTHDLANAPSGVDLAAWASSNARRSEMIASELWSVSLFSLSPQDQRSVHAAVASIATEELTTQILQDLHGLSAALSHDFTPAGSYPLERITLRPLPEQRLAPYHLLWPRLGLVPFLDHADALSRLEDWCLADDRVSVCVISGQGGSGKTRTALELCRIMSRRAWIAGLYRGGSDDLDAISREKAPRLVVLDYANDRPRRVIDLVERLAEPLPLRSTRVRILLLVRPAASGSLTNLSGSRQTRGSLLLDNATHISLSHRNDGTSADASRQLSVESRKALFDAAVQAFAAYIPAMRPHCAAPAVLAGDAFDTPLFVLLLAIDALFGAAGETPTTQKDLLRKVLAREQDLHWGDCPEPNSDLARRAVCIPTLVPIESESEALHWLREIGYSSTGIESIRLAQWLHNLYSGARWANPLEPDLLGECLLSDALTPELFAAALACDDTSIGAHALQVFNRTHAYWGSEQPRSVLAAATKVLPSLIERWLLEERSGSAAAADALSAADLYARILPDEFLLEIPEMPGRLGPAGAQFAVSALERALSRWRGSAAPDPRLGLDLHAQLASRLLSARQGGRAAAVVESGLSGIDLAQTHETPIEEAVIQLLRAGAKSSRGVPISPEETLRTALVRLDRMNGEDRRRMCGLEGALLQDLADELQKAGRTAEALDAMTAAAELRREAVNSSGPAHSAALARTLRSLAKLRMASGHTISATELISEAIEILRSTTSESAGVFGADLARALETGAKIFHAAGSADVAASHTLAALEARRRLAASFGFDAKFELILSLIRMDGASIGVMRNDVVREAAAIALDASVECPDDRLQDLSAVMRRLSKYMAHEDAPLAEELRHAGRELAKRASDRTPPTPKRARREARLAMTAALEGNIEAAASWLEISIRTNGLLVDSKRTFAGVDRAVRAMGDGALRAESAQMVSEVFDLVAAAIRPIPRSESRGASALSALAYVSGWRSEPDNGELWSVVDMALQESCAHLTPTRWDHLLARVHDERALGLAAASRSLLVSGDESEPSPVAPPRMDIG